MECRRTRTCVSCGKRLQVCASALDISMLKYAIPVTAGREADMTTYAPLPALPYKTSGKPLNFKRITPLTLMAQLVAIILLAASAAAVRAQSVSFAGAQTTVPVSVSFPSGVAVDAAGDVFIADTENSRVLKVTPYEVVTTVPFTGLLTPVGVAVDGAGDVFVSDENPQTNRVVKITPAGVQTTLAFSGLNGPFGVAVDSLGDVFVADFGNNRVEQLTPSGVQSTVFGGLRNPFGVAVETGVVLATTSVGQVVEFEQGYQATLPFSGLVTPEGVATDKNGNIYVSDVVNDTVVELSLVGDVQTTVPTIELNNPQGLAVDGLGNVFIADNVNNRVVEVQRVSVPFGAINVCPAGQTTPAPCSQTVTLNYSVTASGTIGTPQVLTQGTPNLDFTLANGSTCTGAVTAGSSCTVNVTFVPQFAGLRSGAVEITDGSGNVLATTAVYGVGQGPQIAFGPGTPVTVGSGLSDQTGVAVDGAGNVFIADGNNGTVVKVPTGGGTTTTVATGLGGANTLALDGAGNLFIADPNNNHVLKVAANGAQTTVGTGLSFPSGVAVDGAGDVFIADSGNNRVVEVPSDGPQTTVGTGLNYPTGVAVDGLGDVFIADVDNRRVVEVPAGGGTQTTVGTGLNLPIAVAVDGAGDVFITDQGSNQAVEVPAGGGTQTTVATGLDKPYSVALDAAGDIFIGDALNNRVLELQRSQPPTLSFAATNVGQTSSDSPQSITVQDIGNQPLTAIAPGLSIGANFAQVAGSGTPEDCASGFSLAAGASCNLSINFTPTTGGSIQSSAVLTDNALNANPATQSITLTGTGNDLAPNLAFATIPTQTYGVGQFWVSITSNSTGSATFSLVSGPATISGTLLTITGAGTVTLQVNQAASGDYTAGQAQTTFTVNPAPLTVTASSATRAYGAANPAFTYAVTGFVNGDSSSVVSGTATEATTATSTSAPGSYPVNFSAQGLTASNYTLNYVPGTLTVTQASQTITFSALPNVTYGVSPIALTATASSSQPVTYAVAGPATVSGSTLTITGAGTVSVTASVAANTNYTAATAVTQSFTVAQAALTVTASSASRAYGAANPAFTYTIAGFVNGDSSSVVSGTATESTTATSTSAPGTYPVSFSAQGLTASNYTLNYVPGALTVTQASQTITFSALSNTTYGAAPIALTATASSSQPVTYTVTGPATVSGSTLTITGAGTVSVTANVAANINYTAATAVTQSFTVAQAALTVTASSASRAYGAANPALIYTITGFVNGDSSSVVSGTATEITTATSTSAPGSYTISFSTESLTAANYIFNYVNGTLTINQTSQTITFAALPNVTYGAAPIALTATASSGLSVTYTVTGPAAVSGSTLSITGVGTVTVTASQAGNADYTAATAVTQNFTVNPATPTLTFTAVPNQTYGAAPFAVSATSNSTGAITYSVASGPATISGNVVTITGVGTVTLKASQAAAGNYAAGNATTSFSVSAETPTLTFTAIANQTYGAAPFAVSATSNSTGAITYSVASGPATVSGNIVTITGVGTVTLKASQAAAGNYAAGNAMTSFSVSAETPTLSFSVPNQTYGAAPFAVSATSNSTGAITYSVASGPATISGNIVTITGVGTVTLKASQAAAGNYAQGNATTNFSVSAETPTLSFSVPNQTYGAAPFAVSATSSSTGAITYSVASGPATISGNVVTITGVGTVTLKASQAAAGNYAQGNATTSFSVSAETPTLSFSVPNQTYGAAPFAVSATSNSTGAITYSVASGPATISSNVVTITGVGTVTLKASQAATTDYNAATVQTTLTVNKAAQTITFNPISSQAQGAALSVSATASSGLAVSFTSQTAGACSVSGTTVTTLNAGTCTIQASQAGNADYAAATSVSQSFSVSAAFTITPNPATETVTRGVLAAFILQITPGKGFSGNVTLSCSGGPAGSVCADLPQTVKVSGVAYAVSGILFPANTTPGTYTITFTGVSGSLTNTATAKFTVVE
jgi:sugar lactone lactonase YvrE